MKIEIDLDQYFEGGFEDRITSAVCYQVTEKVRDNVYQIMAADIAKAIQESVAKKVDEAITEKLAQPIQQVNNWGEPTGKTSTITEMVAERWAETLKKQENSSYSSKGKPVLQELITKFALVGLQQEAEKSLKEINEEAKKQVQETIKEIVAMQLTKNISIR